MNKIRDFNSPVSSLSFEYPSMTVRFEAIGFLTRLYNMTEFNHQNKNGETALMIAVERGLDNVVSYILNCNKLKFRDILKQTNKDGNNVLQLAKAHPNIFTLIQNYCMEQYHNPQDCT